jgi:hypothetical protein
VRQQALGDLGPRLAAADLGSRVARGGGFGAEAGECNVSIAGFLDGTLFVLHLDID